MLELICGLCAGFVAIGFAIAFAISEFKALMND